MVNRSEVVVDACVFRAFTVGDDVDVWGFQSESTRLFLGLNRLGKLKVQGRDLRSYEQFALNAASATTALLSLSSFFGIGGWLTCREQDKSFTFVRATADNKPLAARFRLVNLDQIAAEAAVPTRSKQKQ